MLTGFNQATFVGEDSKLDSVPEIELGQDSREVSFNGCLAEVQLSADLGIRQTPRDQSGHRKFAVGQIFTAGGIPVAEGRRTNCSSSRLVTAGASMASPWATTARDIEDKRARARAAERGVPKGHRKAEGRLVEGAVTTGWKAALGSLAIAHPDRLREQD